MFNRSKIIIRNLIRRVLYALGIFIFLAANSSTIKGQSALDGFDPGASGRVLTLAVQADGKILVGGFFTMLGGGGTGTTPRNNIGRLHADGSLDTTFDPGANDLVLALAVQADGKVLVGGNFTTLGGGGTGTTSRRRIGRLNTDGSLDTSFGPAGLNGAVRAIAVQADGKILVGGDFSLLGPPDGTTRNHIERLNPDGTLDSTFNPGSSGAAYAFAVQADGKILVGGTFTTLGGGGTGTTPRNYIGRLHADGSLDTTFNPGADNTVFALKIQADGKILAGGFFSTFGGGGTGTTTRNSIGRLHADGALDTTFNPGANGGVYALGIQGDGKILVGGEFTMLGGGGSGTVVRNRIGRLSSDGLLDTTFSSGANSNVLALLVQMDRKILVGGDFVTLGGGCGGITTRNSIGRFYPDSTLDATLDISIVGVRVYAIAIQPDGKILIGGTFTSVLGVARNNIARLNPDCTLDAGFNPNANNDVHSLALQSDGKILAGGSFTNIGGQSRNFIARLDATTGLADSFNPNAGGSVSSIALQQDGKVLAGGAFETIGGQPRFYIGRIDGTTGLADAFNPNSNSIVFSIAVQSDGKVLAGGTFTNIGGQLRNRIARLDETTGSADSFDPNADHFVFSIAVQSDGKVLAGGAFSNIGGQVRNRIARLDASSGSADSFDPNADSSVFSIAVQSDGKILVGGQFVVIGGQGRNRIARLNATSGSADSFDPNSDNLTWAIAVQSDGKVLAGGTFTNIGGQPRSLFSRLSNNTAALSQVSVTKTTITLARDGSAAQFTRVIFEQSLNNGVTYTFLGNGTPSVVARVPEKGKNEATQITPDAPQAVAYTLTGLNLPDGQNVLIRARGYFRTGFQNGSETTEDKVQNAFLLAPTAANISVSGRVLTSTGTQIPRAIVSIIDAEGQTRTAITNQFGYFRFEEIETGQTYIIDVRAKSYTFAAQVLTINEDIKGLIITAK